MIPVPPHLAWFTPIGSSLNTKDGKRIEVYEFCHTADAIILSSWAKHFRNHYCFDDEIDDYRSGYGFSRKEYLNQIKFPDPKTDWGPMVRAGDFSEVLVADYLEYSLNYWVPRTRYGDKHSRNESSKGSDILGFKILHSGQISPNDTLFVFECKAQLSTKPTDSVLERAVSDSKKDVARISESLNAIRQRLKNRGQVAESDEIKRFQNKLKNPYRELYGAAAVVSSDCFEPALIAGFDSTKHPNHTQLTLLVIHGDDLMTLAHHLYERAADEA